MTAGCTDEPAKRDQAMLALSQTPEPDPVVGPEFAMDQPVLGAGGPAAHHTDVARGASGTSLAVWAVGDDIYGARVDSNGTVLDASAIAISTAPYEQSEPAVAYDGTNWVVVWSDGRSGSGRDIYGARVSSSGAVLDPNGFVVSALAIDQVEPDISAGATNSLVAWTENYPSRRLSVGRVSSAGVALDGDGIPLGSLGDSSRFVPALSFGGTSWLLVWQEFSLMTSTSVVRAIQLTDSGTGIGSTAPTLITTLTPGPYAYGLPAAAHDGANWLVSWSDGGVIRGVRVAPSGALLDTSPISISAGGMRREMPAVAASAGNFLVLWKAGEGDGMFVAGRRVSSAGVVLDTVDLELGPTYFMPGPAAAYDGTRWLAVWPDGPEPLRSGVSGARIATDGSVVGDTVRVAATPNRQTAPAAASNGTVWLVAWCDHREGNTTEVYGTRVSAAGTVLDTSGIPIAAASGSQCRPAVASNGTDWFVAWDDYRNGTDYDIYGARVSAAGTVLDPNGLAISTAAENQMDPAVSASGTAWLVVWEDQRTVPYSGVYGARVSTTGEVLDPTGIPLSAGPFYETAPAVAFAAGRWLVAWQESRSSGFDIFGTRVATDGSVLDANGIPLTTAPDTQSFPALSSDGTNWLALWNHREGEAALIRGTRVNGSGVVLDPSEISVATTRNPVLSSVSHDGVRWLAAWQDSPAPNSDVHATRLDSSGTVLDPSGFAISESPAMEEQVAVAGEQAGRFVVAYHSNKGPEARVRARVVCVPVAATDATCDAIDDDCSGAVDEDYASVPTQCGTGTCTGTGTTSCVNGAIHDDCVPDLTDQDSDGVPDCADACPMTPAMTSDGCPEGGGGAGGSGQAGESGEAGGGAAGSSGSAGIGGAGGRGGSAGDSGDGGDAGDSGGTTGGDAGVGGEPGGASGGGNGDSDDGGCGCRLSSRSASQRAGLGFALLAVGLIFRRRRRGAR